MQNAIELSPDPELQAELYSELAWETSCRSGMWRRMPDYTTVDEWIETCARPRGAGERGPCAGAVAKGLLESLRGLGAGPRGERDRRAAR